MESTGSMRRLEKMLPAAAPLWEKFNFFQYKQASRTTHQPQDAA